MRKHDKNPIVFFVSFSLSNRGLSFTKCKVRSFIRCPLFFLFFFKFFNFAHCFPAVILPTIPIELVNEVYNVKYQRRGVAPRKESRIGFARRLSRIISQVNEQRSWPFVKAPSLFNRRRWLECH